MKKTKFLLAALLIFIVSVFGFTSCHLFGDPIVGKYQLRWIEYTEIDGVIYTKDMVELEMKADHTYVLKYKNFRVKDDVKASWTYTGTWGKLEREEESFEYYYLRGDSEADPNDPLGGWANNEIQVDGDMYIIRALWNVRLGLEKKSFFAF